MVEKGHSVTVYNRKGKHVSGGKTVNLKEYKGVKIKSVPTFENGKLNAIVYSVIATFLALSADMTLYIFTPKVLVR